MQKQEIANLILKILGVYVIVQAIAMFQYPVFIFTQLLRLSERTPAFYVSIVVSLLPAALMFGAGFILIRKSDKLAPALLGEDSGNDIQTSKLSTQEIQAIAFSVVGLYIFVIGVPKLFQFGFQIISQPMQMEVARISIRASWPNIISTFIQCLLGAGLFLQAQGISKFWYQLKRAGDERG